MSSRRATRADGLPARRMAVLLLAAVACSGGDTGPRLSEEERARQLDSAYTADSASLRGLRDDIGGIAAQAGEYARVLPESKDFAERLGRAFDATARAIQAGVEKRYTEIPAIARDGLLAADSVAHDALDRSIKALDSSTKLLDASRSSDERAMARVDAQQSASRIAIAMTQIGTGVRNLLIEELSRLITFGPREVRVQAFDVLASLETRRSLAGLDSVLRDGYRAESDRSNRRKMSETLNRLGIPLTAPARP